MAYIVIADSEKDPESPGTTTLFTKLRDNPIAMIEGAAGAPRIVLAAINYALSEGLTQGYFPLSGSESGGSFVTQLSTAVLFVPPDANTLTYSIYQKSTNNNGGGGARLKTSTNNGTQVAAATDSGLFSWDLGGTLDVSDKSGFTVISLDIVGDSSPLETVTVSQVAWSVR